MGREAVAELCWFPTFRKTVLLSSARDKKSKKMLDGYKNTSSWTACPLKMWQRRSFETSGTTYPQAEGCGNLINQNLWRSLKTVEVGPVSWHITVPCQHVTPGYTLATHVQRLQHKVNKITIHNEF